MNTEKLYETACESLRRACVAVHDKDEDAGNKLYGMMVKDPELYLHASDRIYWYEALPALEVYMMAKDELGKAKGGTAYSAFKRIIKRCENRANLKGVWTDSEGRSCVCDGYLSIRLKKPMEGFESVPGVDLDKVFPNSTYFTDPVDVEIPTPGELKIRKRKLTNGKAVYDFGKDLPMVDAGFLKDVMDCLPDAKAVTERNSTTRLIYFTSDKGDAILLPVRKRDVA